MRTAAYAGSGWQWPSGVYLGKLSLLDANKPEGRYQSYVVFIVRDERPGDIVFQCGDNTWQAYIPFRVPADVVKISKKGVKSLEELRLALVAFAQDQPRERPGRAKVRRNKK